MSFLSKLTIDDQTMNVLKCSFAFEQGADFTGRPSQRPRGGQITILIESTNKTDFLEWMISSNMTKSGEIIFYKRDNLSSLKTIKFKDAYCLNYVEDFDAVSDEPLKTHIVISAKEISIKDTTFKNNWPDKV
ncbi:type VI secretion system tube protein TssD [Olleya sp. Ti.3.14]|uniref:type VI secretion system tube protein TssD n=1 Tax=Olleya sp. Ti.3.14 TaxID=3121297 RepID=UPI00311F3BE5